MKNDDLLASFWTGTRVGRGGRLAAQKPTSYSILANTKYIK